MNDITAIPLQRVQGHGALEFLESGRPYASDGREISYSTLSNEAARRIVTRDYPIAEPLECTFYRRGINDVYLLSSSDGQFALRVSRANWRTQAALRAELEAVVHLGSKGIDVAPPVPRRDGDLITDIVAPEGTRRAVVFRWLKGSSPKYSSETHARAFGRRVALLHEAVDDLTRREALPRMDGDYLLQCPLGLLRRSLLAYPQISASLEVLAERITTRLSGAQANLGDWGFCHGDVGAHNARTDEGRLALFDFDYCGWGWRLFDLATYRFEARRQNLELQAWVPFIEGYLEHRPAAASSLQYIGLFMILRHLWLCGQWMLYVAQTGLGGLPDNFYDELIPFCERIESETGESITA